MKKLIIGVLVASQAWAVTPSFASTRGHLNAAGLLSGAALYSWYRYGHHHSAGSRNTALLSTAGAAYAWHRYNQSKKAAHRRAVARAYRSGYYASAYRGRSGGSSLESRRYDTSRGRYGRRHYHYVSRRGHRHFRHHRRC